MLMTISLKFLSLAVASTEPTDDMQPQHPTEGEAHFRRTFWLKLGLVILGGFAAVAVYELSQYALGACQGYSGAAAAQRSIAAHFGLWSIDPLTCL
jgi:hypothetical protein